MGHAADHTLFGAYAERPHMMSVRRIFFGCSLFRRASTASR